MSGPPTVGPAGSATPVNLRLEGRLRVLQALNDGERVSRADLTRRTGLARATVGTVLADLVREGAVVESDTVGPAGDPGVERPQLGRPPRGVRLDPHAAFAIGVDIARDHLRCVLCDLAGDVVRDSGPVAFDIETRPRDALAHAAALVGEAAAAAGGRPLLGVGVGIASPVDHRTGALRSETILPSWAEVQVVAELGQLVGLPVKVVNDANAGLLAEARFGAARGQGDAIYLRLSAGIGAGIVSHGRMVTGRAGLAGELGHVTVRPDGLICRCGNRGCLETVASPQSVARLLSSSWGRVVPSEELIDLVAAGHPGAVRAVEEAGEAVGQAVASAVMILNPSVVVVGGELAAAGEVLFTPMRRAIERNAMRAHVEELQILQGQLGDAAGVRGAATLILAEAPQRLAGVEPSSHGEVGA